MTKRRGYLYRKGGCRRKGRLVKEKDLLLRRRTPFHQSTLSPSTANRFVRNQKVTASQDDGFVGALEMQLVGYVENTKRSRKS
jgi:hypothetical protein